MPAEGDTQQQRDTKQSRASLRMPNSLQPAASRSRRAQPPIPQARGQPGAPLPALALCSWWAAGGTREGPPAPPRLCPALPHGCATLPRPGGWLSPGLGHSLPTSAALGGPRSATPPPALEMQAPGRTLGLRGSGGSSPPQGLSSAPALRHPPPPAQPPPVPRAKVGASAVRGDPLASGDQALQVSAPCSALSRRAAARGGRRLPTAGPGRRGPCERPKCHQNDPTANGTSHHGDARDKAPR